MTLIDQFILTRDMATALRWLPESQLENADLRREAYRLFTPASAEDMTRFDRDALTAARAYRSLYPMPAAAQVAAE